ncbi:molecular chaperone [Novosphingobium kaempferiae]|uniref:fimbrial biogenesis chaperone n=1 Tax=Novosphingobium kaempferiae TaxID=2896849 RepID=UPI001E300717|nr:molecular chaperone [Novosphingobium kaempferiae]
MRNVPVAAAIVLAALPGNFASAQTPGSLLIWPVNPVIEADEPAAALWLENPGRTPVTLQVRVYAWAQRDGENVYAAQNEVLGTPPILSIAPGERQLVRLTRTVPPPGVAEKPYRIVVDQIPTADAQQAAGASIAFRMRYSLPLFSYAKGAGKKDNKGAPPPPPHLAWRAGSDAKGRFLEIRNDGAGHARLTDVAFTGEKAKIGQGLFGYVLPGATMRWPLPGDVSARGELVAKLNGEPDARIERLPE